MTPTMLSSESLLVVLLPLAVGLVIFYVYLYRREARQARQLSGRQKLILRSLRVVVALLALAALIRPAVIMVRHETRLPVVPILIDESTSMAYPDVRENMVAIPGDSKRSRYGTAMLIAHGQQEKLTLHQRVKQYLFSDTLKPAKDLPYRSSGNQPALSGDELFRDNQKPLGDYSNIGDSLDAVLSDLANDKISGVVLLTDGRQTGGAALADVAAKAKKFGIPIHPIVLGNEFPLSDLRINEVVVDNEASLNDVLNIQLKVSNQISDTLTAELTLTDKTAKSTASKKYKLKRGDSTISFQTIPETTDLHEYHIELQKFPDEVDTDNNSADFAVNVVKRDMRALLIAGRANRDYFYLVPALMRHPTINLACFLQSADPIYVHQGHITLEEPPKTNDEWKPYDVVILYDVDPTKFDKAQLSALEDIVKRGAGLVIIGGPNFSLASMVQVNPVLFRQLLPVNIDKKDLPDYNIVYDKPFAVERVKENSSHEILRAAADDKRNDQIWASFPQLFWSHSIHSVKPEATDLLHRSDIKGDAGCVMAVMRYGNGKVFYSGINSFWRWRFPSESYDYDNFWLRVLRYVGQKEEGGKQTNQVALGTDHSSYAPGEDVQITLKLLDTSLTSQLAGQKIYASISNAAVKDREMVPLTPSTDVASLYRGLYRPRQVGSMGVQVQIFPLNAGTDAKPIVDTPKTPFQVKLEALEAKDTSSDLDGMRMLAEETGGKYFDYRNMDSLSTLADAIPHEPQVLSQTVRLEIWDSTLFLLLFLVLISVEWCLRKLWGLL
jgi:hypothetical protein